MGDVAQVAGVYLCVGLGYVGIELGGILQLEDTERYAVDEEQHVGDAHIVLRAIGYFKLVDGSEDVALGMVEVDEADVEVRAIAVAGISESVADEPEGVTQLVEVGLARHVAQVVDHLADVGGGEVGIAIAQVDAQVARLGVFNEQRLTQLAVYVSAGGVLPALCLQQVDEGFFILAFVELSLHGFEMLGVNSPLHQGGAKGFELLAGGGSYLLGALHAAIDVNDGLLNGEGREGELNTAHFRPIESLPRAAPRVETSIAVTFGTFEQKKQIFWQ